MNMNLLNELNNLPNLLDTIPVGFSYELLINNHTIKINRTEDTVNVSIESVEEVENDDEEDLNEFDDSQIKEQVKTYKEKIELLDDNTFIEVLEKLKEEINIDELDDLLELETFNCEQAERTSELIDKCYNIIKVFIRNKVSTLVQLYDKFD